MKIADTIELPQPTKHHNKVKNIKKTPVKRVSKKSLKNQKLASPPETSVSETSSVSEPQNSPRTPITNRVDLHSVSDVFFYLNRIVQYSTDSEYVYSRLVMKIMAAPKKVEIKSPQLFALAMFWVYAKTYECRQPDLNLLTQNTPFSKAEVIQMEFEILEALNFDLFVEIPSHIANSAYSQRV